MERCHFGKALSERLLGEGDEFAGRCDDFSRWFSRQLAPVQADVEFQLRKVLPNARVGVAPDSGGRVFEVAGGDRRGVLQRDALLSRVPSDGPFALGVSSGVPLEVALGRVSAECGLDLSTATVRVGFGRGHLLHLCYFTALAGCASDPVVRAAAERFTAHLLGENVLFEWVGRIEVAPAPRRGSLSLIDNARPNTLCLEELVPAIRAGIDGLKGSLPDAPHARRVAELAWTLLESEPTTDVADAAQNDLIFSSTATPELLRTFLLGEPVASCRFTNAEEVFCYLKWYDAPLSADERVKRRDAYEAAINQALRIDHLGVVVGTGLGLRHSYLSLALSDGGAALERLLTAAHAACLAAGARVMFFDTAWDQHWLTVDGRSSRAAGVLDGP